MINQTKASKLIKIYQYVCDKYEEELKYTCERFSNNDKPEFTDQEIMTIYLFSVYEEQRFKIKEIHDFASNYLRSWFQKLNSYVAFNTRLNRLSEAVIALCRFVVEEFIPKGYSSEFYLLYLMPIITCSGKRKAKVAKEITDKSYCSNKNLWYYSVKLHALNYFNKGNMPHPENIVTTKASENDLTVFKENWATIQARQFFGDKIYHDKDFFDEVYAKNNPLCTRQLKELKGKLR